MEQAVNLALSYPGLIVVAIILGIGVIKKLLKLSLFAGLLLVIWIAAQNIGMI